MFTTSGTAVGRIVALVGLVLLGGGCSSGYEYQLSNDRYHVVELGRVIELREVQLRDTASPWNPWENVLVEPCNANNPPETPCWPSDEKRVTQTLLKDLDWNMQGYRSRLLLLQNANYLNRSIAPLQRAWVVGTKPLIVAWYDPKPDLDAYVRETGPPTTSQPTTGVVVVRSMSGARSTMDLRARDCHLIADTDLAQTVNVLLVFPDQMTILSGDRGLEPDPRTLLAHVWILRDRIPLSDVMQAMTGLDGLNRYAAEVGAVRVQKPY